MKLGPIDGSPTEVRDLFENNGLRLEDYLEKQPTPLKTRYLVIPSVILGCGLLAIVVVGSSPSAATLRLVQLLAIGGATWVTVSVQVHFSNRFATVVMGVASLLMLLLATETFSLQDAAEFVKDLRKGE